MFVTVKYDGKKIKVLVTDKECPRYKCFSPHKYQHIGRTIDGKPNNHQDEHWSCSNNNYHGCPDKPEMKEE